MAAPDPTRLPAHGKRSPEQIRADIERQQLELKQSMDLLRGRVRELSDWRAQLQRHRNEIAVGAAAVGFAVGAMLVLKRRR